MKTKVNVVLMLVLALTLMSAMFTMAQQSGPGLKVRPPRTKGPCDIYAAAEHAVLHPPGNSSVTSNPEEIL